MWEVLGQYKMLEYYFMWLLTGPKTDFLTHFIVFKQKS